MAGSFSQVFTTKTNRVRLTKIRVCLCDLGYYENPSPRVTLAETKLHSIYSTQNATIRMGTSKLASRVALAEGSARLRERVTLAGGTGLCKVRGQIFRPPCG